MTPRLLIVPGLGDSGPGHWQSAMERTHPHAERVRQRDWHDPDVEAWAACIEAHLDASHGPALVVAHSFGCLATAKAVRRRQGQRAPRRSLPSGTETPAMKTLAGIVAAPGKK